MSAGDTAPSGWRQLWRRPILHFFAIGAVLFGLNAWRHSTNLAPDDASISVDQPRLAALAGIWRGQFGRNPTPAELANVARTWALEEMRVREAKRLGLDRDDSVIRRRLAQKYDFLINNPSAIAAPTDAVLRQYLAAHQDRYGGPSRYSFEQVFFSSDRGPAKALAAAEAALKLPDPAKVGGDEFVGDAIQTDATEQEIRQDFGSNFASAMPKLKLGIWQGPVESGFGIHLVRITARKALAPPDFKAVREAVLADWMSDAANEAAARTAGEMEKRYHVQIDEAAVKAVVAAGGAR
jgi:hypothetical protein